MFHASDRHHERKRSLRCMTANPSAMYRCSRLQNALHKIFWSHNQALRITFWSSPILTRIDTRINSESGRLGMEVCRSALTECGKPISQKSIDPRRPRTAQLEQIADEHRPETPSCGGPRNAYTRKSQSSRQYAAICGVKQGSRNQRVGSQSLERN